MSNHECVGQIRESPRNAPANCSVYRSRSSICRKISNPASLDSGDRDTST